jgi:hypothetical protein
MTLEVNGARALEFAIGVLFQFDGDPPITNKVRIMTGGYEDYPTHLLVRIDQRLDDAAAQALITRGIDMGLDVTETADRQGA